MVPEKPYVDPSSDLVVTWAQGKSTTLTCFDNFEILATFKQKLLIRKKSQKMALEHLGKHLQYPEPLVKNRQFSTTILLNSPPCIYNVNAG